MAVIVNDVASVNIDSKLVRGRTATQGDANGSQIDNDDIAASLPAGIVELQNGCACCSLSGELLSSVSELMTLSDMRQSDDKFDHIVIEMSGVAEPSSVRNIFQEAIMYDMPLMERVRLDTLITVIDCSTYLSYLKSQSLANASESPELFGVQDESIRWMDALIGGDSGNFEGGVCDLLVEQTEVADVLLLNKVDLLEGKEDLEDIIQLVSTLNPRCKISPTSFGKIEQLADILAVSKGEGVAMDGVVDDHKDFVTAADEATDCSDPDCTNSLHAHDHGSHNHSSEKSCGTDIEHSHSNSHTPDKSVDCVDPGCTDPSHGHSHSHSHSSETTTHANIGSFVYRARRPFHPTRLIQALKYLPVVRGVPELDQQNDGRLEKFQEKKEKSQEKIFHQILRSKGFAWTADSNVKALYWSHAGSSFEMQCLGRWWATLPQSQWPNEARDAILADFDSLEHDDSAVSSSTVGDRRQEIVFIGPGLGGIDSQTVIKDKMDSCLLNDAEWDLYRKNRDDEASLASKLFENHLQTRMLTY